MSDSATDKQVLERMRQLRERNKGIYAKMGEL